MRKYILVTYDISDEKRVKKMFKLMRGYGEHVQYSIFLCQLTEAEQMILMDRIHDLIHHEEDQVLMIALGNVDAHGIAMPEHWKVMGLPFEPSNRELYLY